MHLDVANMASQMPLLAVLWLGYLTIVVAMLCRTWVVCVEHIYSIGRTVLLEHHSQALLLSKQNWNRLKLSKLLLIFFRL